VRGRRCIDLRNDHLVEPSSKKAVALAIAPKPQHRAKRVRREWRRTPDLNRVATFSPTLASGEM
jgi:hypothetical protein